MERIKLAICMKDGEYLQRFFGCLMNHYRSQMEIYMFTELEQMTSMASDAYDVFLICDFDLEEDAMAGLPKEKILYLYEEDIKENRKETILYMDKYSSVPEIVDAIGIRIGDKELLINATQSESACEMIGVYSLNAAELQFPFFMMLANSLSERHRVLVVDLQANSGLSSLCPAERTSGMEDLLVVADAGKYSRARLISAIGHYRQWDYIYPVRNSECLCEADYVLYKSLLSIVTEELGYEYLIINLGDRFQGFFQLMEENKLCFLLADKIKKCWREAEFYEELEKRSETIKENLIVRMELAVGNIPISPERLADQWQWNEIGDVACRLLGKEIAIG